jgi:hypothetical protein
MTGLMGNDFTSRERRQRRAKIIPRIDTNTSKAAAAMRKAMRAGESPESSGVIDETYSERQGETQTHTALFQRLK